MTLAELITLSTDLHTQLYEHWSIFISLHLALLGGLFAFDIEVKTSFKWGFLLFYGLFASINLLISINLLNQVDMITLDMQSLEASSHLGSYLLQDELNYAKPVLVVTHLLMGLMVLAGIFIPSKSS
ncbi:MAG: hypothetical protein ACKE9I_00665 [Methylophagaceae bacterium]